MANAPPKQASPARPRTILVLQYAIATIGGN